MATTGSFVTNDASIESGSSYPKRAQTTWTASYDSAAMQWTVTWSTTAQGGSSSGKWTTVQNGSTSITSSNTMTPANPSASMSSPIDAHNNDVLTSGSFKIAINSSTGVASFTMSMSYHFNSTGSSGLCSASQAFTLDTVPLASSITTGVSSLSITSTSVSALSYTIRSKANFYHELKYGISESTASTALSAQNINNTTYSGTITIANILAKFPAATSGTLYLYLKTYRESSKTNQVGSTQITAVTISISKDGTGIKPTISLGNIAVNSSPISGYYVAGFSSAKSTVSGSSPSSSTISKIAYTISYGSISSTNGQINAASGTITTTTLPSSTSNYTLTISATVYDARGGSATASKTATVYAYKNPVITANIYRTSASSGSSPARDDAGEYVYISFSASQSYTVNGQNSIQSTVCTASGSITGNKTSGTFVALTSTQSATFTIVSTDKVSSTTKAVVITTATYALELYDNKAGTVWAKTGGTFTGKELDVLDTTSNGAILSFKFSDKNNANAAYVWAGSGNYGGHLHFREFSGNSSGMLTNWEQFNLPAPNEGRTGNYSYTIITTKNISDIPDASASAAGKVSTGVQTLAGSKTFTAFTYFGTSSSSSGSAGLRVNSTAGPIDLSSNPTNGFRGIWIPEWNGLGGTTALSVGSTDNKAYWGGVWNGDAVAVAKGGTGGTTAAAARSNLNIKTVLLKSGIGTTEVTASTSATTYQCYIVTGLPGSTANVTTIIPRTALSATASTWQINTEGNYIMFTMRVDGSNLYVQVTGPSGTSKTISVYGMYGA